MSRACGYTICFGFLLISLTVTSPATEDSSAHSLFSLPAPSEITELFLRFHDEDLCRGVEAFFVPEADCVKIWCRVRDKGDYRKFLKMLRKPSECVRLEIYSTDSAKEKEDEEKDSLPPSLWENSKLRDILWRPLIQSSIFSDSDTPVLVIPPEEIYRQHLRIFSEQTLEKGAELEQYAAELPVLTPLIFEPSLNDKLRGLAVRVCREHAENVDRVIRKLEKNLKEALPGDHEDSGSMVEDSSPTELQDITDLSAGISERAQSLSRQVYSFIYPDLHTVELNELRHPDILFALKELREMNEKYVKKLEQISPGR